MPDFCAAYGCSNQRSLQTRTRGITFHKFPKSSESRRQWELAIRRDGFVPSDRTLLCSEHFRSEDFDKTGQTVRLKAGVVPTVFNFPAHLQRPVATRSTTASRRAKENLPMSKDEPQSDVMPRHCSAGGCKSRDNRETRNAGVTFHKLPKEAGRRSLWITHSHRSDSWDPRTDFVYFCSKHFTPESFELTGCSGIRRLKEDAFPTVFDSTAARSKRQGRPLKREHRKPTSSGGQENTQPGTGKSQAAVKASPPPPSPSPSPPSPRLEDKSQGTHQCQTASSQEPVAAVEAEQPAPRPPSPRPEPRSVSPSRYMRRLPPPPGFYLPKEHSYAQLCPLLWRRRYDQAIDCLERALRQLHAARRRENRLRSTVLRLRDRRLKHTLLVSRDSPKHRAGWTPGGGAGRAKGGFGQEGEADARCDDAGLFEDRCADAELGGGWTEDRGHCFYCGRGPARGVPRPEGDEDPLDVQGCTDAGAGEGPDDIQVIRVHVEPVESGSTNLPLVVPATLLPAAAAEHTLQLTGPQQDALGGPEHGRDAQQQQQRLFWIHENSDGQLVLVPVPDEDDLQSFLKVEGVAANAQPLPASELGGGGPAAAGKHAHQHPAESREDVREKLKEHLEGFHLQLSTEFQN